MDSRDSRGTFEEHHKQLLTIIGAPIDEGAGRPGALMGPAALRTAGLIHTLKELGHPVDDRGDLRLPQQLPQLPPIEGLAHYRERISAWSRLLAVETHAAMQAGALPIILGGDHSLSMGSISGVARHCAEAGRELFVLWLDAHSDFNTPLTSPSGNMHGMSAALLCGEPGLEFVHGDTPHGLIKPGNLHLFGIRSIDASERVLLRDRGIDVIDMRRIDEVGLPTLLRKIIERVERANGVLHVSLDVDFVDPSLAPGVGTTVPGGATYREAHLAMEMLHDSGLVCSLDVVELNPFLDERGKSALLLVDLVASMFGRSIFDRPTLPGRAAGALTN
ncbi:arginase [Phyllobacterium sp. 21LDTY02-6]|uniref:arginase n=1 Tax=unclassified Phyllobacterium TaxID=2638441 RepID=UPI00202262B8|nr:MULTISPECIES: arginase [unclassified Phyllobacterium]MCO4316477.1 arginase [Phyllobacterium sp. 21LDTY02-6]MCX8280721.1 arginase [Phyllobacterium sp. 0TCS1.6C]MCX8292702.1 arginase [Phyllobacterium sp. 0TCS1.6A]